MVSHGRLSDMTVTPQLINNTMEQDQQVNTFAIVGSELPGKLPCMGTSHVAQDVNTACGRLRRACWCSLLTVLSGHSAPPAADQQLTLPSCSAVTHVVKKT